MSERKLKIFSILLDILVEILFLYGMYFYSDEPVKVINKTVIVSIFIFLHSWARYITDLYHQKKYKKEECESKPKPNTRI